MTHTTLPPLPALIPDTAPFSPEQRSWLNGFLAGLLSLESGVNPLSAAIARRLFTVSYASLVNILAQRQVVPELLQEASTPDRLACARSWSWGRRS